MAKRITPEEREQIIALFPSGLSCRQIAEQTGRSIQSVSNIAREESHVFGRLNVSNARVANLAYGAERRATIRLKTVGVIEDRLQEFSAPTLVYSFGGRDNDYNEHTLDKPDARTMRDLAQTIATLWRVVQAIDAAEETRKDTSRLEVIFSRMDGIADDYERDAVEPEAGMDDQP